MKHRQRKIKCLMSTIKWKAHLTKKKKGKMPFWLNVWCWWWDLEPSLTQARRTPSHWAESKKKKLCENASTIKWKAHLTIKKKGKMPFKWMFGAGGGTWTHMKLPSRDFESRASAISPHQQVNVNKLIISYLL